MEVEIPNYLELFAMKGYRFSVAGVYEIFREIWIGLSKEAKKQILLEASKKLRIKAINLKILLIF